MSDVLPTYLSGVVMHRRSSIAESGGVIMKLPTNYTAINWTRAVAHMP